MKKFDADIEDRIARSLRLGQYNILLGAAASLGSTNEHGEDLPLSEKLRSDLCTLKKAKSSNSLQRIFGTLSIDEIEKFVVRPFQNCNPGPTLIGLTEFTWNRIFSLNIDDALEKAYSAESAYQLPEVYNFTDPYVENRENSIVPIIHLHGMTARKADGFVFSRDAYVQMIQSQNPWMIFLCEALATDPFIIIGSSLDEVDIDYFLSRRTSTSFRTDRGPSILVEPFGDVVTDADCERYGLLKYSGTGDEFLEYARSLATDRPRPMELISPSYRELFPSSTSTASLSTFFSDFEYVPSSIATSTDDPKFFFGHPVSWSDLALNRDIGRRINTQIASDVDEFFKKKGGSPGIIYISDDPGGGKSTTLARIAFDFSRQGLIVLRCSALGRLEPRLTSSMLDLLDGPTIVIIDNIADHIIPLGHIMRSVEKSDILFIVCDRKYRQSYITQWLEGLNYSGIYGKKLTTGESKTLIDSYSKAGLIGEGLAVTDKEKFSKDISHDPIAVACCRILNDFRPLDRIINSMIQDTPEKEISTYLLVALAAECFSGGIHYNIVNSIGDRESVKNECKTDHQFSITFSDSGKDFLIPANRSISSRILMLFRDSNPEIIYDIFKSLAVAIAPRVNRQSITRRSPEARLAGRLLDYDLTVEKFLGDRSLEFFDEIQGNWQWNSRYWEQKSLLRLEMFLANPDSTQAEENFILAAQHARQAVSLEHHPLTLTTLAKVLLVQMRYVESGRQGLFDEAFGRLAEAIASEQKRKRVSIQPYIVLFKGVRDYLESGEQLSDRQSSELEALIPEASRRFGADGQVADLIKQISY